MNRLFKASIRENKELIHNHYLLTLHPAKKIIAPKPGQFFMLSSDKDIDPLLKRPFSLFRSLTRDFQIVYRVVGKFTSILKDKKPGEVLRIIGPLGNGFPSTRKIPILVGGGLGTIPLIALAERLKNRKPVFFIGAKTKNEMPYIEIIKSSGITPAISTDDGTMGRKGFITGLLGDFLAHHPSLVNRYCLYACGPKPMLKELAMLSARFNLEGYVALEENMACGIGACMGCVVSTKDGYKRVCKEGPVFPIQEIVW